MYQEEILKAIKEQTEAIKRQTEAIELIARGVDIDGLVKALVPAFVRELERQENMCLDAKFLSFDPQEMKRRGHEEMKRQNREAGERKAAAKVRELQKGAKRNTPKLNPLKRP